MKNKRNICLLNLILSFALLLTANSATQAQPKPDLIITNASMTKQKRGDLVYQITVTVTVANYCLETTTSDNHILLDFYTDEAKPPARSIYDYNTVQSIPSLAGGESKTTTFKITKHSGAGILGGAHSLFQWLNETGKLPRAIFKVDIGNQVKEADENNNWRRLNPNEAPPKLGGQYQCSPKV
ncbi:MAG: hypothetical protein LC768_04285 [Acidobacteria bacterium]|nr:hypothetical protein [Acidobacteriota bacterium]MCA1637544.1 hypothetical protein [Acidobacteriota bacterium]